MQTQEQFTQIVSDYISERNLTKAKFAKLTGITSTEVTRILAGKSNPSLKNLLPILEVVGYEITVKNVQ